MIRLIVIVTGDKKKKMTSIFGDEKSDFNDNNSICAGNCSGDGDGNGSNGTGNVSIYIDYFDD